jgi:nucleotide-binding universal stress UspA family protein
MIRSILLPVADGPLAVGARDYAFWLARQDGSLVHALAVIDIKAFEIPVMGTPDGFMPSVVTPPIAESQTLLDEMVNLAKGRLEQLAGDCAAQKIPCTTDVQTGIPGEVIGRAAVAHDIVVMARSGYTRAAGPENRVDPLVTQVIRASVRPVLVAGRNLPEGYQTRNVLVAYDGSGHAARALSVAAELGSRPGTGCKVITVAASEEAGLEILGPAEAYLRHHGISPQTRVVQGTKPADVICDIAASAPADILVMGAYGHRPMREMLFGSTTERVLSHCWAAVVLQS